METPGDDFASRPVAMTSFGKEVYWLCFGMARHRSTGNQKSLVICGIWSISSAQVAQIDMSFLADIGALESVGRGASDNNGVRGL